MPLVKPRQTPTERAAARATPSAGEERLRRIVTTFTQQARQAANAIQRITDEVGHDALAAALPGEDIEAVHGTIAALVAELDPDGAEVPAFSKVAPVEAQPRRRAVGRAQPQPPQ